jgi:ribosome-binding factor A
MAHEFSRMDRIGDLIQRELSVVIMQEMKDPRLGLVTISHVHVSKDMAHAKVLITVLDESMVADSVKALNSAAGFLRSVLSKKMHTRIVPHLAFHYDANTIAAERLTKIIDKACSTEKHPTERE